MKQVISGVEFRDMIFSACAALEMKKQECNELNVFPVPDGDTGTNMSMTIGSAAADLPGKDCATVGEAAKATANAMLRGARGNSGVILSLLFRGISRKLKGAVEADGVMFAEALQNGVEMAYKAVMNPAEGTILTVSRMAAGKATEISAETNEVEPVLAAALEAAQEALAETVNQNPVLKKANVVDAGGYGYVLILDGMLKCLRGEPVQMGQEEVKEEPEELKYLYAADIIVKKTNPDEDESAMVAYLETIGDDLNVKDTDGKLVIHVHTNDPDKVLKKALAAGEMTSIKVINMKAPAEEEITEAAEQKEPEKKEHVVREPEKKYGFVTVCAGDGLAEAFRELGADSVISGGQTMNPSTQDILLGIDETPAEIVFVLPNNKNIIMAAQQTIPLCKNKKVIVIPTKTVPQGITALMTFDESVEDSENEQNMLDAIQGVHTASLTYAARNSNYEDRKIKKGDYLGMLEGKLVDNGHNLMAIIKKISEQIPADEISFLTVIYGEDVKEEEASKVVETLQKIYPDAEVSLLNGGQPVYYYLISAE